MIKSQADINSFKFNNRIVEIFKFSGVGIINTLIDFTVFTFLTYALSVNISYSQAIGYGTGVINSFVMNRKFTFKANNDAQNNTIKQLFKFIIINLVSLAFSSLLIGVMVGSAHINVFVSKVLVTLVTQAINYLGYKLIVFKSSPTV